METQRSPLFYDGIHGLFNITKNSHFFNISVTEIGFSRKGQGRFLERKARFKLWTIFFQNMYSLYLLVSYLQYSFLVKH